MDSWAKAPDFEGDPVRSAAVRAQTAADRHSYTQAGMQPVRCASCAVRVLVRAHSPQHTSVQWPPEVVADGPIALARLIPAGVDVRGNATRARIVLFRKPIERRAKDTDELAELLHEVLVAQVATYLGVDPDVIDSPADDA